jgi:CheY-like chemotaxis protein
MATHHTAREAQPDFSQRRARILLAEDNITNQQVALAILRKLGVSADVVANGREALDALKTLPYDLVLMDMQMPEMDGLEATRRIRDPQTAIPNRSIPIVAMTANAMQSDREMCLEAGMNDYITKPVSPAALAGAIEKWLPEAGGSRNEQAGKTGSSPFAPPSVVIWDRAGMLERMMGDEDLARTISEGFLDDMLRQIARLKEYLKAGDAASAERQAHTIKGAASIVGGEALRAVAFEMEKAGQAGDLGAVKARMDILEAAFDQLRREMNKAL